MAHAIRASPALLASRACTPGLPQPAALACPWQVLPRCHHGSCCPGGSLPPGGKPPEVISRNSLRRPGAAQVSPEGSWRRHDHHGSSTRVGETPGASRPPTGRGQCHVSLLQPSSQPGMETQNWAPSERQRHVPRHLSLTALPTPSPVCSQQRPWWDGGCQTRLA